MAGRQLQPNAKQVLIFGDQTESTLPHIREIYRRSPASLYLQQFLRGSSDAVRRCIYDLSAAKRGRFYFDSFLSLAESYDQQQCSDPVVQTLLLCIAQLGTLVMLLEDTPDLLHNSIILGWCTGLLPAAVASSSHSMVDVLRITPEIVTIAVKIGVEAYRQSELVEKSERSWSFALSGLSESLLQQHLDDLNLGKTIPPLKVAYISAVTGSACTVSGPPSTLDLLRSSMQCHVVPLRISAPFHAGHLTWPDWKQNGTLGQISGSTQSMRMRTTLLSPSTGRPYQETTLRDVLPQILEDIFRNQIRQQDVVSQLKSLLSGCKFCIVPIVASGVSKRLESTLEERDSAPPASGTSQRNPRQNDDTSDNEEIAIIGMSGRFPGAESLDAFWEVLKSGMDLCQEIPRDRFDTTTHYDPTGKKENTSLTPFGCFLDRPGVFDARMFNMSPREAASTDPGQRLLLMSTYEALERAGYSQEPSETERDTKVGSFFGQTIDDWREYNAAEKVDMYYVTGGIRAFSAGRVNYHFKWDGPAYSVDSACSSSLLAIQLACKSLSGRECNMAVAGGSNIVTGCNMYSGLSRGSFLSQTGACKTFDSTADGYCRGEGVGVVVLKRMADALANGDPVLAVIKSAATNHSAKAVSITHPHVETQERLFRDVLAQGGVNPIDVDYVEFHGTGTQAGDAAEAQSVVDVFGATHRARPLTVGSVKPNIGHGEAAAGVCSLIKTLMMLQHQEILPHSGVKGELNPKLSLFPDHGCQIATSAAFSREPHRTRTVMVNNFSAAGGNTSILIQDSRFESPKAQPQDPRTGHVVTVSGKTAVSLVQNVDRLSKFLETPTSSSIAEIAYTSTSRRLHHPLRRAYAVTNIGDLAIALEKDLQQWDEKEIKANKPPPIIFVFPGQGSKVIAVAKELYETSPAFCRIISELENVCVSQNIPSFMATLVGTCTAPSPLEAQLCLAVVEVALARLWQSWGVEPQLVVGHSLGEYAALCVAGVISAADMVFLVAKRASLMHEKCVSGTHKMLSLRISVKEVNEALAGCRERYPSLEVACINGLTATVVSGLSEHTSAFKDQQESRGVTAVVLDTPYAFHSGQMDPILEPFERAARGIHFAKPAIPVASTYLGSIVKDTGIFSSSYLSRQARDQVRWSHALNAISEHVPAKHENEIHWIEAGPGTTCLSLIRQSLGTKASNTLPTLDLKRSAWECISSSLSAVYQAGVDIRWTEFHRDYKHSLSVVSLPTYAFDLKNYWVDYTSRLDQPSRTELVPQQPKLTFASPCWQKILHEDFGPSEARVEFASDFSDHELFEMASGHMVNGIGLCPSSIFASMAFSCALYVFQQRDDSLKGVPPMDISDMEIFSPCIISPDDESHPFTVTAVQHSSSSPNSVQITFGSSTDGTSFREHARCFVVRTTSSSGFADLNKNLYLVKDRVELLRHRAETCQAHRLRRSMVYKLFKTVVDYSEGYQALDDVYLSTDGPEAFARLSFQSPEDIDKFVHNPFWIDNFAQIGGFALNISPPSGRDDVYISHGWQSMRVLGRLSCTEQYTAYVCMQPQPAETEVWAGDVYVFNEKEVVAVCYGLKFKEMRRSLLNLLLHNSSDHSDRPVRRTLSRDSRTPSTSRSSSTSIAAETKAVDTVLDVIAKTAGLTSEAFGESSTEWSDLGIDSLLSIAIIQKLREETGMDLPSSFFTTYPSVGQVCRHFGADLERPGREKVVGRTRSRPQPSKRDLSQSSSLLSFADSAIMMGMGSGASSPDVHKLLMSIIATEVGLDENDLTPSTQLSELGMDSLLTITVLSVFRERTGINLASSFFIDCPTPSHVKLALQEPTDTEVQPKSIPVLLQGTPKPNGKALFLLPDGSGSALSYMDLPQLTTTGLPVYALPSPFAQDPDAYTLPFETVAAVFVRAVRELQPYGPYLLGGWSMGGIFAWEAARQLLAAGERVDMLAMIDSPCPRTLPPLPAPTLDILDRAGIFAGLNNRGVSKTTRRHFLASVRALETYTPQPLETGAALGKVVAVWAKGSVLDGVTDEGKRKAVMSDDDIAGEARDWLVGLRKDFGPAGWDRLVATDVECRCIPGNHFSIMKAPLITEVASAISDALKGV
ncbi:PKS16 protein [Corynespora cassiicola Philippines]|uniref:PKS16 protein n=1 Tax=Corynespora cassiicola Philippines TaxID=1448308 RepID=A0A2T2NRS3_CORCC|nr:PKS16 protein [Corynespora cassiicola Philippines]